MRARSRELLNRAVSAMVAAVEVYNKPDFPYRAESFTILALNSWELLIKAKWLTEHRNKLSSLYVREGRGKKRQRIKRTRSGNPRTHDLLYLARKLREEKKLEEAIYRNLEVLEEFRNSSIHFYHADPNFAEKLQQVAMAAVKNFHTAMREWFDEDLSRFNFYQMPLSFVSPPPVTEGIVLRRAESRFLNFIRQQQTEGEKEGSLYLVSVNVEVRFVRSKKTEAEARAGHHRSERPGGPPHRRADSRHIPVGLPNTHRKMSGSVRRL